MSGPHRRDVMECECPLIPTIYDPVCAILNDEVLEYDNACAAKCAYVSVVLFACYCCFGNILLLRYRRSRDARV